MDSLEHGLAHLLHEVLKEIIKNYDKKELSKQSPPKENRGFTWVTQEIRELEKITVESVEKGKAIPYHLYCKNPEAIGALLNKWGRQDLIPIPPKEIYTKAEILNDLELEEYIKKQKPEKKIKRK